MANFSDGTYHPPNTHYAEFKPTRGGRLIHGADYGDNNQYDTYSRNYTEQPRVYNSDRFDYDYSRNQNYSSDVYTQGYDEWGSYYEGRERESRGTRGRPRGGRGKRGRGGHKVGRQFEETRQDPEVSLIVELYTYLVKGISREIPCRLLRCLLGYAYLRNSNVLLEKVLTRRVVLYHVLKMDFMEIVLRLESYLHVCV